MNLDVSGFTFLEQLTSLNSTAIMQISKKVDKIMAAIDDLTAAEASLSAVINDAVLRVRALEAAVAVVPPANEAAIADIAARLVHLREYLASAVYAMPTAEDVAPAPAPAPGPAPVHVEAPVAPAEPVVTASGAPIVETAAIEPSIGG